MCQKIACKKGEEYVKEITPFMIQVGDLIFEQLKLWHAEFDKNDDTDGLFKFYIKVDYMDYCLKQFMDRTEKLKECIEKQMMQHED